LQYRKFDQEYMDFVAKAVQPGDLPLRGLTPGQPYVNELPVTTLAVDRVTFPVDGVDVAAENPDSKVEPWQRWNDYGIGLFLEGKAELRQAADAFAEVEKLGRFDGPLNLARVLEREGRLDEAVDAIRRAATDKDPSAPPWVMAWLSGVIDRQQGRFAEAELNLRAVLETRVPERKFDFSLDYEVINLLGQTLYDRAKQLRGTSPDVVERRRSFLQQAAEQFRKTLTIDSEDVTAHYSLALLYRELEDDARADEHQQLHERYREDNQARGVAVGKARERYPAANHAAESLVIYSLTRFGAPELPALDSSSLTSAEVR
jgi:tetratricopeptide (TPR) repeat protein